MTQFTSLTYYSFNAPSYYSGVIILTFFSIFYIMMYLALKYETYNRINHCDPQYYYGEACRNQIARTILTNPDFSQAKNDFYDKLSNYDASSNTVKGIDHNTKEDEKHILNVEHEINHNLDKNQEFTENTIHEINEMTDFTKMLSSKYLGDVQTLIGSVKSGNTEVEKNLKVLPEQINILKHQIDTAIVTPTLARYTAPLQKLYKSLTHATLDSNEYNPETK